MSLHNQHSFWGSLSPLGGLAGAGILIMASARFSWAIIIAGSLFWVYGLTSFTYAFLSSPSCKKIFPICGRKIIYACIAAFFGVLYLFLFFIMCPPAALEVFVLLMLVPLFCTVSCFTEENTAAKTQPDISEQMSDAVAQAASLAGLLIAFSIIREPLSYNSISFPGTYHGLIKVIDFKTGNFFPVGIFAPSAGALLLLGYFICLYQYYRARFQHGENK